MEPKIPTLTLDGVTYNVTEFSQQIQSAVTVYNTFNAELQKEQLAAMKTQAALQTIGAQISEAVRKELAAKAAASTVPADEVVPASEPTPEV